MKNEGQREGDPAARGADGVEEKPVRANHSPELMSVHKTYRKGRLLRHTVEFSHDCGATERFVQEELPWLHE